jgi:hypothetical protein
VGRSNAAPVDDRVDGQIGVATVAHAGDCSKVVLIVRGSIGEIVTTHAEAGAGY